MMSPSIMLAISFVIVIIISFTKCNKHGLSKLSTLLFITFGYCGGFISARLMGNLYSVISLKLGGGEARLAIFGVVVSLPFFLIACALASGKTWRGVTDLFAPGAFLGLAFSKFGCFIYGCCPGIECEFGFYNHIYEKVMFPSQLFESITMCLIVIFSFWYNYRYKNKVDGTAYPVTAIVYSVSRFIWEFLRYYDIDKMKHLFLGLSFWQLWCIAVFAGSCIWLLIMRIPKLPEYEEKYYAWHKKMITSIKNRFFPKKDTKDLSAENQP